MQILFERHISHACAIQLDVASSGRYKILGISRQVTRQSNVNCADTEIHLDDHQRETTAIQKRVPSADFRVL